MSDGEAEILGRIERWQRRAGEFLRALFDLEFREWLTPRMVPMLYLLAIIGCGYIALDYVIEGFARSLTAGLLHLLLSPLLFLLLVTLSRVGLETCLVLFRLAAHLSEMAGHTEEIAGGLPRINFWRNWWRRDEKTTPPR